MTIPAGAARFSGFASLYAAARPCLPEYAIRVLLRYAAGTGAGHTAGLVIDLGCGAGLSTIPWRGHSRRVIGVEPNPDMLAEARRHAAPGLTFHQASAEDTGLPGGEADIVVCAQSFHWMDPEAALREAARLLRPGGVFATVDYDWPPVSTAAVEEAFRRFEQETEAATLEAGGLSAQPRREKTGHLDQIRKCGYFSLTREVVFLQEGVGCADRLLALAVSRSGWQEASRRYPEAMAGVLSRFRSRLERLDEEFPMDFGYRLRFGVRKI